MRATNRHGTTGGGPKIVLKYLARYTHRVAISNWRLLRLENGQVTFAWKDYAHGNRQSTMTLTAVEFIRRFPNTLPADAAMIVCAGQVLAEAAACQSLAIYLRRPPTGQR